MAQKKSTKKTAKKTVKKTVKKSTKKAVKKTVRSVASAKTEVYTSPSIGESMEDKNDDTVFYVRGGEAEGTNIDDVSASEEQERYASILHYLSLTGLGFLIVAFFIYVTGLLPAEPEVSKIPEFWSLSSDKYIAGTGVKTGWTWIGSIGRGNVLSFASLVFLAIVSITAFIGTLPIYLKKKDNHYILIVIAQILVLIMAASGVITGGGH